MTDYSKSSNNQKQEEDGEEKPERRIEKVVTGDVVVKKHGLGRKFQELVKTVDIKGISKHVFREVIIPLSAKMAYDAWAETGSRVFLRNAPRRPIIDARTVQNAVYNYNGISRGGPISRASSIPLGGRPAPPREIGPRSSSVTHASAGGEQYIFSNREDAVRVLDLLRESLDMYQEPISLIDLYEAMGLEGMVNPTDKHWGWDDLSQVKILQSRDGFILDFPKAEQIQ